MQTYGVIAEISDSALLDVIDHRTYEDLITVKENQTFIKSIDHLQHKLNLYGKKMDEFIVRQ